MGDVVQMKFGCRENILAEDLDHEMGDDSPQSFTDNVKDVRCCRKRTVSNFPLMRIVIIALVESLVTSDPTDHREIDKVRVLIENPNSFNEGILMNLTFELNDQPTVHRLYVEKFCIVRRVRTA